MTCEQAAELICEKLDGVSDALHDAALEGHLRHCAACRDLLWKLTEVDADLHALPQEQCGELSTRVMQAVNAPAQPKKRKLFAYLASAAALALVLFAGFRFELLSPQQSKAEVQTACAAAEAAVAEECAEAPAAEPLNGAVSAQDCVSFSSDALTAFAQNRRATVLSVREKDYPALEGLSSENTGLGTLYETDEETFLALAREFEDEDVLCRCEYGRDAYYILISSE